MFLPPGGRFPHFTLFDPPKFLILMSSVSLTCFFSVEAVLPVSCHTQTLNPVLETAPSIVSTLKVKKRKNALTLLCAW